MVSKRILCWHCVLVMEPAHYLIPSLFENDLEDPVAVEEMRETLIQISAILCFHFRHYKVFSLFEGVSDHELEGVSNDRVYLFQVQVLMRLAFLSVEGKFVYLDLGRFRVPDRSWCLLLQIHYKIFIIGV